MTGRSDVLTALDQQKRYALADLPLFPQTNHQAKSVAVNPDSKTLSILTTTGVTHSLPIAFIEKVSALTDEQLQQHQLTNDGHSVKWDALDLQILIHALICGCYGGDEWMQHLQENVIHPDSQTINQAATPLPSELAS